MSILFTYEDLKQSTITSTVNDDLTSAWIAEDLNGKKWECKLLNYNPLNQLKFKTKEEVELMKDELCGNINYWSEFLTVEEQKTKDTIPKSNEIRDERDALLNKYEWTVNSPDLTDDKKAEWKTYRQALRDLPDQSGFPWDITWPTKPTS